MTVGFGLIGSGMMGRTYTAAIQRQGKDAHVVAVTGGTRAPKLAAVQRDGGQRVQAIASQPNLLLIQNIGRGGKVEAILPVRFGHPITPHSRPRIDGSSRSQSSPRRPAETGNLPPRSPPR